jgi:phage protein D/phage baseplate assembly protein gpV
MPVQDPITSRVTIKVNNTSLDRTVIQKLLEAVVDQNVYLPDFFTLRFSDPGLELADQCPFDLTTVVKIEAEDQQGNSISLVEGEVTAIEPSFNEGMIAEFAVQGYDASHRLFRETKSKAHQNKKDSDLATEIAQAYGLRAIIDPTKTVYEHIFQHNQTDLAFLMQRAWRIGYECFVSEKKLYFRKPLGNAASLDLTWGDDLLSFKPRVTLAEQVDEVVVKGWDVQNQKAFVGRAQKGSLYVRNGESKDGGTWAHGFGNGKTVIIDQPVTSQAEADILAAARLDEISGAFIEAEGVAFRRPELQAGRIVNLKSLGKRFSGVYRITSARHLYTSEGLVTHFVVRGARSGLLAEQINHQPPMERWPGVVIGKVTDTDDPDQWGRVKVKFPWMSDDASSAWARVIGIGAGNEAGFFVIPDVDDEVAVIFEFGNFDRPFVIGGLWNGKQKPPPETAAAGTGEKPLVRVMRSRKGHSIAIYDNQEKIDIKTNGGHTITLNDQDRSVIICSEGQFCITVKQDITIEGRANMTISTNGNLNVEAKGSLELKGKRVSIEGQTQAMLKGNMVTIEGSGVTEVKGSLVKIN